METEKFELAIRTYHEGVDAFVKGDAEPQKAMWSRRDDVTLANPVGPPVRGWEQVDAAIDRAAAQIRDGEPCRFEPISQFVGEDLAYMLEIQATRARLGATDELGSISLRVTTVFRLEDGEWKVVHRHADPLTGVRPIESIAQ
jgi:ketosteroid isomerase-like protein